MANLLQLAALEVVKTTTLGAINDDKDGIMKPLCITDKWGYIKSLFSAIAWD